MAVIIRLLSDNIFALFMIYDTPLINIDKENVFKNVIM